MEIAKNRIAENESLLKDLQEKYSKTRDLDKEYEYEFEKYND